MSEREAAGHFGVSRAGVQGEFGPALNEAQDEAYWLAQPGAPWPRLADERGTPMTVAYDELIRRWTE